MEEELQIVKCSDEYEDELKLIEEEIRSEKGVTNMTFFDKKDTNLVLHNGVVVGQASVVFSQGIPTLQYGVISKYRNKGYGNAILNILTNKCFNEGYDRVELMVSHCNIPSIKTAEKCGYYRNYDIESEFNLYNSDSIYITYYKNNYRKMR